MKKTIVYSLFLLLFPLSGILAQDSVQIDTTVINEYNLLNNKTYAHFSQTYFAYSYVNWMNLPDNLTVKPFNSAYTLQVALNLLKNRKQHNVNLGTGFAFDFINLNTNAKKWKFDSVSNVTSVLPDSAYDRNKAAFGYFSIPVEFKFLLVNKPKNALQLALGFKVGTLMYTNIRTKLEDVMTKEKIRKGVNKLNYDLYGHLSYKFIGIYGQYRLSPVFNGENAPDSRFWSAGLSLFLKF